MSFLRKLDVLRQSVRLIGLGQTWRWTLRRALLSPLNLLSPPAYSPTLDTSFDEQYGTDTAGTVLPSRLGIADASAGAHASEYEAAPARVSRLLLASTGVDPTEFTFVDYGCGKGRVLLLASELPFKKIVGIDISKAMCEIAKANVSTFSSPAQRCADIEVVCADAREYRLPPTDTVFYLYHPFDTDILASVLKNMEQSLLDRPRRVCVLYLCPFPNVIRVFDECRFLKIRRLVPCLNSQYSWALFANE